VFKRIGKGLPRLARVWADSAYRALAGWAGKNAKWVLDIVRTYAVEPAPDLRIGRY
jgi:hypothetical protein